jgi:type IV pilus assembly protein PilN
MVNQGKSPRKVVEFTLNVSIKRSRASDDDSKGAKPAAAKTGTTAGTTAGASKP